MLIIFVSKGNRMFVKEYLSLRQDVKIAVGMGSPLAHRKIVFQRANKPCVMVRVALHVVVGGLRRVSGQRRDVAGRRERARLQQVRDPHCARRARELRGVGHQPGCVRGMVPPVSDGQGRVAQPALIGRRGLTTTL